MRRQLEDAMAALKIEDKVVRIVTDNASNNLEAFDELIIPGFEDCFEPEEDDDEHEDDDETKNANFEENSDRSNIADYEERLRIPYFSHTLHLTVAVGLKECGNATPALGKVAAIAKLR